MNTKITPQIVWIQLLVLIAVTSKFRVHSFPFQNSAPFLLQQNILLKSKLRASNLRIFKCSSEDKTTEEWINPFEQSKTMAKNSRDVPSVVNISYREMRMNELVSSLLRCVNDEVAMDKVLKENEELLMEPFLDDYDPRLDPNSIYEEGMSRVEKIKKYTMVMENRMQKAKSDNAKIILNAMKNFVLDFDED